MDGILKDIPLEGKIMEIGEDTVEAGNLFFPRRDLRITLYVENEILGLRQRIFFIRSVELGNILSSLLNDFKDGEELRIRGRVSYFLIHPLDDILANKRLLIYFFKKQGLPKEYKGFIEKVAHLVEITAWEQISKNDKDALGDFFKHCPLVFAEHNDLQALVGGKVRYAITTDKNRSSANIFLKQAG